MPAVAAIALLHGYGEHCGRYAHVCNRLAEDGVVVCGRDLTGHGARSEPRGAVRRFTDYHADVAAIAADATAAAAGAPVFLLGHSMGGLLACHWLLHHPQHQFAGLILSSPFLGVAMYVNPVKRMLGHALSRLLPWVSLPSQMRTEDVCRDRAIRTQSDNDPLNHRVANARWFTEALTAMALVQKRAPELALPTLVLYAERDRIVDAAQTRRLLGNVSSSSWRAVGFPQAAHELFNEPAAERAQVFEHLSTWLGEQVASSAR
jgi:alpha-beta hydrolase superfamily lysophospholipase